MVHLLVYRCISKALLYGIGMVLAVHCDKYERIVTRILANEAYIE